MRNNIIALIIISIVLFTIFNTKFRELFIDDNYMLLPEEVNIVCGRTCCATGWPTGIVEDERHLGINPGDLGTKFLPSNQSCITGMMDGCVCIPNEE